MAKAEKTKNSLEGKMTGKEKELVVFTFTKDGKFHKKGASKTMHKVQADKLVQKGLGEVTGKPEPKD